MSRFGARAFAWAPTFVLLAAAFGAGCADVRPVDVVGPTYDRDIRPLLVARCGACHGTTNPAGGWSASRFTDVVGCLLPPVDGGVADGGTGSWPSRIAAALARPDHATVLDAASRATLQAWFNAGAPPARGTMHDPGFADPRSTNFHSRFLRAQHWAQMLDPTRADSCGRCHEGAPTRPAGVTGSARNAPACTTCHDQPGGPLACGTCHGDRDHANPPRDPCLFPTPAASTGAHVAHLRTSALHQRPFTCQTCHPARTADFTGDHGNGVVDFAFDPTLAGADAAYDRSTRTCTVRCHHQGGHREAPVWTEAGPMTCNDCHTAPPANHARGTCTTCHAEPDATGTSLRPGPFHLSGAIDLGNGNGTCTACHGTPGDAEPWPSTGSHASHRAPRGGAPVACTSCHTVPQRPTDATHFENSPRAAIHVGGNAVARGAMPAFDAATLTCAGVACHGAGIGGMSAVPPRWGDTTGAARRCGQCHGLPPPPPHTTQTDCSSVICHGGEVAITADGPVITEAGRALHQNGVIDHVGVTP